MIEIWQPLINYEDFYRISNFGIITTVSRVVKFGNRYRTLPEIIRKPFLSKNGYLSIQIKNGKKNSHFLLHRLLAIHFIPNPLNLPCINHKDGNKLNNSLENLEWCTQSYNIRHAFDNGLSKPNGCQKIKAINLISKEEYLFDSYREASRILFIDRTCIADVCNKKINKTKGYTFTKI